MPDDFTSYYIPFTAKGDDSRRIVEGYVSSPAVDCDEQIVDQDWLKSELPSWIASYGNIREQHNPLRAVGKAQTVDVQAQPGPYLAAKIVDDDAWRKVKAGVYNGFSVGIKGPRIVYDGAAKNGRIAGGKLIEISIVDRPANDAAKFVLLKRAGEREWQDVQEGAHVDLTKAVWSPAEQDALPDASFAYIEDGGTKEDGKTRPLSKRHFPYRTADGKPDPAHVRNALARIPQSTLPQVAKDEALAKVRAAARDLGIGEDDEEKAAMTDQQTNPVTPDGAKGPGGTPASHAEHRHPFTGVHNHEHDDLRGGTHTHAHLHDDDDLHDHPHLGGKDARMLSPEEREQYLALQRASNGLFMAADADKIKAAASFAEAAPAGAQRPGRLGDVSAILKDALQRIEALAGQTDDRDGDVDTPANVVGDLGMPGTPAAEFVSTQGGQEVVRPETLSLTFASEADLTKFVDARVSAILATQSNFITKAAVAEPLATIPDIAKLAGGLAKGLEALASKADSSAKELDTVKAAVAETQADLAKVKELAQPVKGALFAVEKGVGLEPDRIYRDGVIPDSAKRGAEAAKVLAGLSDNERRQVGAEVLAAMYRARGA